MNHATLLVLFCLVTVATFDLLASGAVDVHSSETVPQSGYDASKKVN